MKWSLLILFVLMIACRQEQKETVQKDSEIPAAASMLFKAVNQYPDSISLRIQLVNMLDSAGALPLALAQMDSLLIRDSTNFGIWFHKAQLSEQAMDTATALACYQAATRIYPSPDALLSMANLLAEKRNEQAVVICDEVASMRLGREYLAHTSFIKGVYYARTGDVPKAMVAFDQCIGNDYQYMEAYMEKGFLFFDAKQTDKAAVVFEKALEIRPTYADASYWLSKCLETKGEKQKAIVQYQKALIIDPNIKEAREALKRLGV